MVQLARQPQTGFSLLELMITLAIIGILAAIAYPAYTSHVKRGYHNEALGVLTSISADFEVYASSNNGSYTGASIGTLNHSSTLATVYEFVLPSPPTATSYSIKATPKAGGPLADEGPIIVYWDGRRGWDSNNDGTYEAIDF